jgi:hypothetical protein
MDPPNPASFSNSQPELEVATGLLRRQSKQSQNVAGFVPPSKNDHFILFQRRRSAG